MFKRFYRSLTTLTASTLMLGLLAFVPHTLAIDEFVFFPVPATKYVTGGDPYEVNVYRTLEGLSKNIKFSVKKKDGNTTLVEEYTYTGIVGNHTFKWDGKIGNNYAPAGEYQLFIVEGFQNVLTHDFTVENPPVVATPKLAFNNPPADILNTSKQTKIDFQVRLTNFDQDRNINFRIQPEGQNAIPINSIKYNESGTNIFSWNVANQSPGVYQAIFSDDGLETLTHSFNLVNAEPTLSFPQQPSYQHSLGNSEYKVSVDLAGYANDTKVEAAVVLSDSGIFIPQDEYTYKANGSHEFSWDVSDYEPGIYFVKISGLDTKNNITNELIFPLTITEKAPTLAFVSTPASTYTVGSGNYKASVKLTDFTSETLVAAHIVDVDKKEVTEGNFTFTSEGMTHEFSLDMADYKPGDYELKILGEDKDKVKTNVLIHKFKVVEGQSSDPNSCAGYKDLKKTDWSCAAAEWAKAQGIITGQGGGDYFDGYAPMNRAEQAKIALMAHKKYNEATDYCKGTKPFSDINLGQWYSNYICLGKEIKVVTGYLAGPEAGQYMPNKTVTLPEMFCLLTRPLNVSMPQGPSYNGLASNQWYSGCTKYVKDNGYFEADYMNPAQPATRFNVLNFLYAMYKDGKL